jgi:hypothetical protein
MRPTVGIQACEIEIWCFVYIATVLGLEIVPQLLVSTATPMALLLSNTSLESKITGPNFPFLLSIAGEN